MTSVDISQNKTTHNQNSFKLDIKGELVNIMEAKIKQCTEAGRKNKISYGIRTGHVVHEIVKTCQETDYDLIVRQRHTLILGYILYLVKPEK